VSAFQAPATYPPAADAPAAAKMSYELSRGQTALRVRIAQLEHALKSAGLEVPVYCTGWELA
jgi:hypothetical protein